MVCRNGSTHGIDARDPTEIDARDVRPTEIDV